MAIPLFNTLEQALVDNYVIRPRGDAMRRIDAEQNQQALENFIANSRNAAINAGTDIRDFMRLGPEEIGWRAGNAIDQRLATLPRVLNAPAGGGEYSGIDTATVRNPTDFSAVRSLLGQLPRVPNVPVGGDEYGDIDTATVRNPTDFSAFQSMRDAASRFMTPDQSQAERYQAWLSTPAGQSFAKNTPNASQALLGSSAAPTAPTDTSAITPPTDAPVATPQTDPADVAGDNDAAVGDKQNWFDRINSKVDLMAMGAAMLANSGSGMGTAANFGKALQTGIASRAGQEKAAKDQQMAEALLLIRQQEALAKMAGDSAAADRLKNFNAARSVLSSLLQGAGAEEGADVAAEQIIALAPTAIANLPPQMLQRLTAYVTEKAGDNWFSSGGDIDQKKVQPAVLEFLQNLRGAR